MQLVNCIKRKGQHSYCLPQCPEKMLRGAES